MSQHHPYRDLAQFPTASAAAGSKWWRITSAEHLDEPWWFSNSGNCRFDLNQHSKRGTCYLATELLGALAETVWRDAAPTGEPGKHPPLAAAEVAERRAVQLTLAGDLTVADITHDAPPNLFQVFGVSFALGTCESYQRPQEWAAALDAFNLDGIRYELAHGNGLIGLAVFGAEGARAESVTAHQLTPALLAEHGIDVLEDPDAAQLAVIDDPDDARSWISLYP